MDVGDVSVEPAGTSITYAYAVPCWRHHREHLDRRRGCPTSGVPDAFVHLALGERDGLRAEPSVQLDRRDQAVDVPSVPQVTAVYLTMAVSFVGERRAGALA